MNRQSTITLYHNLKEKSTDFFGGFSGILKVNLMKKFSAAS